jgi:sn-glycerol 3-phosphate transport system substrate-binding protein
LKGFEKNAKFKVGTAFLPEVDQFGCPTGGSGLVILARLPAEKQQAAMQYIAYATSPKAPPPGHKPPATCPCASRPWNQIR